MQNLKELHRQRRSIIPDLRRANTSASKNPQNLKLNEEHNALQRRYELIVSRIHNETQQYVFEQFGQEVLDKWNRLQFLRNQSFTTNSEMGRETDLLTTQLIEVTDLLDKIEAGLK